MILFLIFLATLAFAFYHLYPKFFPAPNIDPTNKFVLISGCDTGFGNMLAHELDRKHFRVFAGVLNENSVNNLKSSLSSNATVFRLDITKSEDIDKAFELVQEKTEVLHALVNNAGIGATKNIEWTSMELIRKIMEVNFFGHVQMTKKFLPLLTKKKDSRVVNICSVAGYLGVPRVSAYSTSKFALEAFSDCLRREMLPWNLLVSIIEPGYMQTPIIAGRPKSFEEYISEFDPEIRERWGDDYLRKLFEVAEFNVLVKHPENPMKVVRALQHAVSSTKPRIRYRPGLQSSFIMFPISMLPAWIADKILTGGLAGKIQPAGVAHQLPS